MIGNTIAQNKHNFNFDYLLDIIALWQLTEV